MFQFSNAYLVRGLSFLVFWEYECYFSNVSRNTSQQEKENSPQYVERKNKSKRFATKMVTLFSLDKECILLLTYLWDIIAITAVIKMFMSIIDWLILGWLHYYRLHSKKNLG